MRPPGKPIYDLGGHELEPGEKKIEKCIVLYNDKDQRYIFQETKEYQIHVQYSGYRKSNTIKIQAKQPETKQDQKVWKKYLKETHKRKYVRLVHVPWQLKTKYSVTDEDRAFFHDLIQRYPKSTYIPYITFSLLFGDQICLPSDQKVNHDSFSLKMRFKRQIRFFVSLVVVHLMAQAKTDYRYITQDQDGNVIIAGTSMKVSEFINERRAYGWSPEEIQRNHPYLSMAKIHSALSYYWDHKQEIDDQIQHELDERDRMRNDVHSSSLANRLQKQKQNTSH